MPRVSLDLENRADLRTLNSNGWKIAMGLVPGEPNQGLVAELKESPARLPDYDDSWWESSGDIQERRSTGFTFAWYRLHVTVPQRVKGVDVAGRRVLFETNADNYGEIFVDGQIDRVKGVIVGNSAQQRVIVADKAEPGKNHVIAVLVANGPLAVPNGTIFLRYATLAFE
jgi:hypothetical protein